MAALADAYPQVLVLRPEHCALRRALGPMPWVALEALAGRARQVDGELVADVSVRSLAAELGVAKDTAARGLAALRAKGVIVLHQSRTALGRFGMASYAITTGAYVFAIEPSAASVTCASCKARPRRRAATAPAQLLTPRDGLIPMMTTSARATLSLIYRQLPLAV